MAPIDPGALLEMEKSARHVATEMLHVMDNLRNSLFAVSASPRQVTYPVAGSSCWTNSSAVMTFGLRVCAHVKVHSDHVIIILLFA